MVTPLRIPGLEHDEQNTLDTMLDSLNAKSSRNRLRTGYYDGANQLRDLGISIPPNMRRTEMVLGWPAKAVDVLSRRCNFEGFVIPGADVTSFGIPELAEVNNFDVEAPQAHTSALIHSCAFIATTLGDVDAGEPEVLITARSALTGTGLWDTRLRMLKAFVSVVDVDDAGEPIELVMYLPDSVITMSKPLFVWEITRRKHSLGRVPVEPLVYSPRLDRPFGSSRISRAVMSLTDAAMRTALRSEVSAEFYSSPQRYLLGADEDAFVDAEGNAKGQWETVLGRMLAIGPDDETGELPTVGQFPQMSMQPHQSHLQMWAQLFAATTSLPVSSLGIVQDNPASAEAIFAAKEELIVEAEFAIKAFGLAEARAFRTAVQLRDGLEELPAPLLKLRAQYRDPSTPSRAAAVDAIGKLVAAGILPADSDVTLELAGFDATTIARIVADRARAAVPSDPIATLADTLNRQAAALPPTAGAVADGQTAPETPPERP